jgi:hypothetical protein
MLRRSVLAAFSLGLGILTLCPRSLAHGPAAQKDSPKPAPTKPAMQVEKSAAITPGEQVYKRAQAALKMYLQDLQRTQDEVTRLLAGGDLGKDYHETPDEVGEAFRYARQRLQEELKELDARHSKPAKDADCSECEADYGSAIRSGLHFPSLRRGVDGTPFWSSVVLGALGDQNRQGQDKLSDKLKKKRDALDNNPNLSSDERDRQDAKLKDEDSDGEKKIFDELAGKYRVYARLLTAERSNNIQELWCWFDVASGLAKSTGDSVHAMGARWANEELDHYREDDKAPLPHHYRRRDLILGNASGYDWSKSRPYRDIQDPGDERYYILTLDWIQEPSVVSLHPKNCPGASPTPNKPPVVSEGKASGAPDGQLP